MEIKINYLIIADLMNKGRQAQGTIICAQLNGQLCF